MKKLAFLALLAGPCAVAQTVSIKKVDLTGEKIIVSYSLQDSNPGNDYQLNLYASVDNFMSPLAKVTGDVGDEDYCCCGRCSFRAHVEVVIARASPVAHGENVEEACF